jgi:hypothetical protein
MNKDSKARMDRAHRRWDRELARRPYVEYRGGRRFNGKAARDASWSEIATAAVFAITLLAIVFAL